MELGFWVLPMGLGGAGSEELMLREPDLGFVEKMLRSMELLFLG
jgi:hypothetical protein